MSEQERLSPDLAHLPMCNICILRCERRGTGCQISLGSQVLYVCCVLSDFPTASDEHARPGKEASLVPKLLFA